MNSTTVLQEKLRFGLGLRDLLLGLLAALLSNKGKPAPELGGKVSIDGRDLNRPARRLATQPAIQFFPRGVDVAPLAFDWHSRFCPALGH